MAAHGLATAKAQQAKQRRKSTREARERIKSRADWLREAQAAFNRYIRLRDASLPCISCGRHHQGQYHAGHYRSVKAAPQLRYNEANCAKQCMPCNSHLSGNVVEYRVNLVRRIGQEAVEALENDNRIVRWTIEDAKRIRAEYMKKAKELENGST